MKVTEIITPNSNQLNEIEFPSFKMPKMRNPFKRGPKEEPGSQEHNNEPALRDNLRAVEDDMLKVTANYDKPTKKRIQDAIEDLSDKWAEQAVAADRAHKNAPRLDSVWNTPEVSNQIRTYFSDTAIEDVYTRMATIKRELLLAKPEAPAKAPGVASDERTKTTDTTTSQKQVQVDQGMTPELKARLDQFEAMIKNIAETLPAKEAKISYAKILKYFTIFNAVDAVILRPYFEYSENMKNLVDWVNRSKTDPSRDDWRLRDAKGNYLDEIDPSTMDPSQSSEILKHGVKLPNGKIRLAPDYFITYMMHSQGRACFIKSVATLTGTVFDERIIQTVLSAKMPSLSEVLNSSVLMLALFGQLELPGVKKFILKKAVPTLLLGATFLAQHNASKLAGAGNVDDMPNAAGVLIAKAIMPTSVVDWLSETVMPVNVATGKINWLIDYFNQAQKWVTGDPANNSPEVTQANTPDANGNMPPPAPEPTNNAAGYPNLVNENRQYWMQNYNGTRVKNPRTGLWESNKR